MIPMGKTTCEIDFDDDLARLFETIKSPVNVTIVMLLNHDNYIYKWLPGKRRSASPFLVHLY